MLSNTFKKILNTEISSESKEEEKGFQSKEDKFKTKIQVFKWEIEKLNCIIEQKEKEAEEKNMGSSEWTLLKGNNKATRKFISS